MNDGGSAFPIPPSHLSPDGSYQHPGFGMTLRDYFAAKAMHEIGWWNDKEDGSAIINGATFCYKIADAMLKAREAK